MRLALGSNLSSLQAQRQLDTHSRALSSVFERLSSGQRINRASDDAAGLSVSSIIANRVGVYGRALLNVSDATSMLNIVDDTLFQVSGILNRMSELAAQAASGSLGSTQRRTLDKEFALLDQEIRRIAGSNKFNGLGLFQGQRTTGSTESYSLGVSSQNISVTSSNGRYSANITTVNNLVIYDSVTGISKTFNSGILSGLSILDNGDVVYRQNIMGSPSDVMRYRFDTETITQLTNEIDGSLGSIAVSADGSTLAFVSTINYTDGGTAASASGTGVARLYVMDLLTGTIRTNGEQVASNIAAGAIAISADGSQVALRSTQMGSTAFGNTEIISASFSSGGVSSSSRLTTSTPASSDELIIEGISNDGQVIFRSRRNITGDNGSEYRQFYTVSSGGSVQQLTSFDSLLTFSATQVDRRGDTIHFVTNGDLVGENSSGRRQLYSLDLMTGQLSQITNFSAAEGIGSWALSISADGRVLTFRNISSSTTIDRLTATLDASNVNFEVGFGSQGGLTAQLESIRTTLSGLGALVISSSESAKFSLDVLSANREALASLRGKIGAMQSRLESAGALLSSQRTELSSALSRIRDADVASEYASLTRLNILREVSSAVLAQANQQPALVISLLRPPD
jgi:flagellin